MDKIELFQKMIDESNNIVFFGGAGVSTESDIKDFRSKDGLYNMKYDYPPEEILSHTFFKNKPDEFYRFYKDKMNCLEALPNVCHNYLYELEKKDKLLGIITQNIDGLHTKAGNKNVIELHGSIYRNYCSKCHKSYPVDKVFSGSDIPKCDCGGVIKPDVVLYEEPLNQDDMYNAIYALSKADLLIVAGTSLTVYPASGLLKYYQGDNIVLINYDETNYDHLATLVFHNKIGEIFSKLK